MATTPQLDKSKEFRDWVLNTHHTTPGLFLSLPIFKSEFSHLKRTLKYLSGKYNLSIISSTGGLTSDDNTRITYEKLEWLSLLGLNKYFSSFITTKNSSEKVKYLTPGKLLIDDFDQNVNSWIAAGGVAIKHYSLENTVRELAIILNDKNIVDEIYGDYYAF